MIDRPPAQGPAPSPEQQQPRSRRFSLGSPRMTLAIALVAVALIGSVVYILYVVTQVEDEQIPLLGYGFAVMGASFAAIALGSLVSMWQAASRARAGRALMLAIVGGIAGMIAIGCFGFTAIATMVGGT